MSKRVRRGRRVFTDEFKAEAVAVVRSSGKSIGRIAQDLDLTETALRDWVRQADRGAAGAALIGEDERGELRRLREEVRVLRMERDFLKNSRARPGRTPARRETPRGSTMESQEEWPSTFWCSANP